MDENNLQQKLNTLASFPKINPLTVEKFGQILRQANDWDLFRVNPLSFAQSHDLNVAETIDLFIHGAKVGLFDFAWNLICPGCGGIEYSYNTVNEVQEKKFHCTICQMDTPTDLDDWVEVAFTLNPTIKKLQIDPFENLQVYTLYFRSTNMQYSTNYKNLLNDSIKLFRPIEADKITEFTFELAPEKSYNIESLTLHQIIHINATAEPPLEQLINIDVLPVGFSQHEITLSPGKVTFRLHNLCATQVDVMFNQADMVRFEQVWAESPPKLLPMFTGKMLLNNQTFRNLFRVQNLKSDLKLNVRSLTVLFTDLKGSTDLYDTTGDAFAYNLIQEHFKILINSVRKNSGAIIKTMGDAIMATFSTPQEGVQAAVEMMQGMSILNDQLKIDGHELGLKVGLHEGTALAVNADERLDYFGQTVNIAARVQGLAKAEEIWLTEPIFQANGIIAIFNKDGYREDRQSIFLKGVSEAATLYRMHR